MGDDNEALVAGAVDDPPNITPAVSIVMSRFAQTAAAALISERTLVGPLRA